MKNEKLITLVIPTINAAYLYCNTQIDKNFDIIVEVDYKHKGPGVTRQKGLDQVKTPYVMFMDDDDYLSPVCIHLFNKIIKEQQPDLILGEVTKVTLDGDVISNWNGVTSPWTWLHGKCYRTEFLREHNITFPTDLRYNEDVYFNTLVREYADEDKIISVDTPVYFFTSNINSLCGQIKGNKDKAYDLINEIYIIDMSFRNISFDLETPVYVYLGMYINSYNYEYFYSFIYVLFVNC